MSKLTAAFVLGGILFRSALFAAPEIGEPAPEFTLKDSNGETHALADYRGKHVILEWINHECPFVQKFYGSGTMQALQKELTGDGVVWLVINSSAPGSQGHLTAETANAISKEKKAAHTAILLDHDFTVAKAYEAKVTPHMYVINPDGVLVYNGAIDSIRSANVTDIEKAENYVLAAFNASKEGKPIEQAVTRPYGCAIKYP